MIEKIQYFELVNLLNKSNKNKNESTDFIFFIENNNLYFGRLGQQRLSLATYTTSEGWLHTGLTKFYELEIFIEKIMSHKFKNVDQVNDLIKSSLFYTIRK